MTRLVLYAWVPEMGHLEIQRNTLEHSLMEIASQARKGNYVSATQKLGALQQQPQNVHAKYLLDLFQLHVWERQYGLPGGGQTTSGDAQLMLNKRKGLVDQFVKELNPLHQQLPSEESVDAFQAFSLQTTVLACTLDMAAILRQTQAIAEMNRGDKFGLDLIDQWRNGCKSQTKDFLRAARSVNAINADEGALLSHLVDGYLARSVHDFNNAKKEFIAARDIAARNGQLSGAAELMLELGDLEVSPYGDAETLGYDLFSESTYRLNLRNHLLVNSELTPSVEAFQGAESWYRQAEEAFRSANDGSGPYRLLLRRAYVAFRKGDSSSTELYKQAAERAKTDDFLSGSSIARIDYALFKGDREAFREALKSLIERGDFGTALGVSEMTQSFAARAWFSYSNPQGAASRLRFAADAYDDNKLNRTAMDSLFFLAEIYDSMGRSEASIEVVQEAIASQRKHIATVEAAEKATTDDPMFGSLFVALSSWVRDEKHQQVQNLFNLWLTLNSKVSEEGTSYWISRRDLVEKELLTSSRRTGEAAQMKKWINLASINESVQMLIRQDDCQKNLESLRSQRSRAVNVVEKTPNDEMFMLRLDSQMSVCDPQLNQQIHDSLKKADPLSLLRKALGRGRTNFDAESQREISSAQNYLSTYVEVGITVKEFSLVLGWLTDLQVIADKEGKHLAAWVEGNRAIALNGLARREEARDLINKIMNDKAKWSLLAPPQRILLLGQLIEAESSSGNAEAALFALERMRYEQQQWQAQRSGVKPESRDSAELAMLERKAALAGESGLSAEELARVRELREKTNQNLALPAPPTMQDIKSTLEGLPSDTIALIYHVSPQGIIVWKAQSKQPLTMTRLQASFNETMQDVSDLEIKLLDPVKGWDVPAKKLYEKLILPIETLPKDSSLVFLLPRSLAKIPFEVLGPEPNHMLASEHPILYTSRIKGETVGMSSTVANGNEALVVGYNGQTLLGAEDEATKVAQVLKTEGLIGANATKARVLANIHSAKWVHLATHGVIDEANPYLSYLSLADDEQIEAWQLFREAPKAEMIVLSACDTKREAFGLSKTGSDLDTSSLSSFAFSGGARWVVASLWKADDDMTAQVVSDFYEALTKGKRPARALQEAKLNRAGAHPSYYSNLVLLVRDLSSIK